MPIQLKGILPALVTPFTPNGELDSESLGKLVDHLVKAGVGGILLFDSTAEAEGLAGNEALEALRTAVRWAGGRVPVIAAVRRSDPGEARQFEASGADALLFAPPRTLPPESQLNLGPWRDIRRSVSLPLILDYASPHSGSPADAAAADGLLASLPDIGFVRVDSAPVGPLVSAIRENSGGRTATFSGLSGRMMTDALDRGAAGATTLCSLPEPFVSVMRYREHGAQEESVHAFEELLPALSLITQSPGMVAACEKVLLVRRGWIASDFRRAASYEPDAKQRADLFTQLERLEKYFQQS